MLPTTKTIQDADADVFTAIAHPVRRQLLDLLAQGDQSVTALTAPFAVSRQAISQHLHILLDVGLVSERRQGRERRYQLRSERLYEVQRWLLTYERFWNTRLKALGKYLEEQNDG
jgi:DNA-binding transcriptional ArsR family regulator